jgi:hypothetical protein
MSSETTKELSVELQIDKFIKESYNYDDELVKSMTLQHKMSMINMKNQDKWEEFKLGLRKSGYII